MTDRIIRKKSKYPVFLPATPCTRQQREQVESVAESEGTSLAEVVREAVTLFLSQRDNKLSKNDNVLSDDAGVAGR